MVTSGTIIRRVLVLFIPSHIWPVQVYLNPHLYPRFCLNRPGGSLLPVQADQPGIIPVGRCSEVDHSLHYRYPTRLHCSAFSTLLPLRSWNGPGVIPSPRLKAIRLASVELIPPHPPQPRSSEHHTHHIPFRTIPPCHRYVSDSR